MTRIFNLQEKGENKTDKIIIRIISVILAAVTLSGISGGLRAEFLATVTPVEDCKIIQGDCYIGYNLLSYTGGCIYKISEMKILPDFEGC